MASRSKKVPVKKKKGKSSEPAAVAPYHPLMSLRQEMDRVFERFMGEGWPFGPRGPSRLGEWEPFKSAGIPAWFGPAGPSPHVDLSESEKSYQLTMELPGMDAGDVELELSGDTLTIKGEKKQESETTERDFHVTERSYGRFRRSFSVPSGVEPSKIGAGFTKGVLTITMPKSKEAASKPKKITVKSG